MSSERQEDQLAKCICNLCECGSHRCSSFKLVYTEQRPGFEGRTPSGSTRNYVPKKGPKPDAMKEGSIETVEASSDSSDELASCGAAANSERYLGSQPNQPTKFKSADELKAFNELDEELLHVLVSKPEVASKPRDNIVFEGDMDLRTTFETSYEALAKMRLDHWRRFQEVKGQSSHRDCKQSRKQAPAGPSSSPTRQTNEPNGREPLSSGVSVLDPARRHSVKKPDLTGADRGCCTRTGRRPTESYRDERSPDPSARGRCACNEQAAPGVERRNHLPQRQNPIATNIDPDLSPIIVYDANMNRLEKVGLRRRSKYRPSTSLRSGSRGLFGDLEVPEPEPARQQAARPAPVSGSFTRGGPNTGPHDETGARRVGLQISPRTELALDARNLKNTHQADCLTYSGKNLPVSSKRRLNENVNMIDHIRDQNIVDNSSSAFMQAGDSAAEIICDENQVMQDSSEELKLAQLEEIAAVEELQRLTCEDQKQQATADNLQCSVVAAPLVPTGHDARHSRLQRTCQNQNFDIFSGQYPEPRANPAFESSSTGIRASPHLGQAYNNLFRESPDFILTTGKFLDQEAKGKIIKEADLLDQMKMQSEVSGRLGKPNRSEQVGELDEEADIDDPGCRVFRLDKDFQYVGSRSGHKYFVEKGLNH